ncbi:hypothetical protein HaGV_gp056 [Helicoverpa armigera granulovirus]|uniref:Uncharacterized protein n=1 Tax=Helicoverpa armigera granulovirus TaxID=489830 RepID=A9YMP8_9BBAC|nr:hypothetical protein HaGV_gp056 [Helicoverpa armigera granulovirus]ABY47747.1 unknown [Helicoverpa armigera granulovirus]
MGSKYSSGVYDNYVDINKCVERKYYHVTNKKFSFILYDSMLLSGIQLVNKNYCDNWFDLSDNDTLESRCLNKVFEDIRKKYDEYDILDLQTLRKVRDELRCTVPWTIVAPKFFSCNQYGLDYPKKSMSNKCPRGHDNDEQSISLMERYFCKTCGDDLTNVSSEPKNYKLKWPNKY